jgi:hypothetical protein
MTVDEKRKVTFTVRTDDGVRLLVDGVKVIESWVDRFFWASTLTTTVTLDAGVHQVEMQYYVKTGNASAWYSYTLGDVIPPSRSIGVVVSDGVAIRNGEQAVIDRLVAQGHTVTVYDDTTITAAQANTHDALWISGTVVASELGSRLNPATVAIVSADVQADARLRMTAGGAGNQGTVTQTTLDFIDAAHPLSAGRTGTLSVLSAAGSLGFGLVNTAPGGATVAAELTPGQPALFSYLAGATLADGSAAAGCRIGVPFESSTTTSLTADGTAVLDAAITFAAGPSC